MSSTRFITVFDLSKSGYHSWTFSLGILFAAGVVFVIAKMSKKSLVRNLLLIGAPIFGIAMALVSFDISYKGYLEARDSITANSTPFVEGYVENFTPLRFFEKGKESFDVNGVEFAYAEGVVLTGFNKTYGGGGPIRQGQYVKIWYVVDKLEGNQIVKLQIKEGS